MEHSILNPHIDVKLRDGTVTVHELKWPMLWQLLAKLSAQAGEFVTMEGGKASMSLSVEKIGALVTGSGELTQQLILGTTGKDEAWLKERHVGEVLDLLDASLNVNLSESIVGRVKKIGSRLQGLFAAQPAKTS